METQVPPKQNVHAEAEEEGEEDGEEAGGRERR